MTTLAELHPSPILQNEAKLRQAFQEYAPEQADIIDIVNKYGDLRTDIFVQAEESWRKLAKRFTAVQQQCKAGPDAIGYRWHGKAFDDFESYVHSGDQSLGKLAGQLAAKATAIANGLHELNELYRITWMELGDNTAAVVGAIVGGIAGAVVGSTLPGVGTVAGAAIAAALGALVTIVIQVGFDKAEIEHNLEDAVNDLAGFDNAHGFKLPRGQLAGTKGWERDTPEIVDR